MLQKVSKETTILARNIRWIRLLAGLGQAEFAERIGTNPKNISAYEVRNIRPNELVLAKIANIAGVGIEEITNQDITNRQVSVINPETKSVEFTLNNQQTALEEKVKALEAIVAAQTQTIEALQLALKAKEKS